MPQVHITKDNTGKLVGMDEKGARAYAKWKKRVEELEPGELIHFTYALPRSGPFHKRHMGMVRALFEAQEQFEDLDVFQDWLKTGAGYCKFVPGPTGKMCALPDSIAFERLDQAEFEPIHEKMMAFAHSLHATRFLWGHLSDAQGSEMVESILAEWESESNGR